VDVRRPVILLVAVGALMAVPAPGQAASVRSISGTPIDASATAPSLLVAATTPPAVPDPTSGAGTRVSVRVLPLPTATPTSGPTPTPTHPATSQPSTGGGGGGAGGGGGLPRTGSDSHALFELGLSAVGIGALLMWLAAAALRRRRESMA
jgi:hypothetical protein